MSPYRLKMMNERPRKRWNIAALFSHCPARAQFQIWKALTCATKSAQVTASAHLCDKNLAQVSTFLNWYSRAALAAKFGILSQFWPASARGQLCAFFRTAVRNSDSCARFLRRAVWPNLAVRTACAVRPCVRGRRGSCFLIFSVSHSSFSTGKGSLESPFSLLSIGSAYDYWPKYTNTF